MIMCDHFAFVWQNRTLVAEQIILFFFNIYMQAWKNAQSLFLLW